MRTPVSAALICLNEEKMIERCLASLTWADEIFMVDGGSTDRTIALASRKDAPWAAKLRLEVRPWPGFREQRNYLIRNAKHDWILVIDADEACSPELAATIATLTASPDGPPLKAYKVRRVEYFLGKEIKNGIWNPSIQDRFFHRAGIEYVNNIHEYPKFPSEPGRIMDPLLHNPDFGPEHFLYKMNKYTSIEAIDRVKNGQRTNYGHMLFAFIAMFLKNYFYYRAYRDGVHGFVISLLEGLSRTVRHVKIWAYSREIDAKK